MPGRSELFGAGRASVLLFCWLGWIFDFHDLVLFSFLRPVIGGELGLDRAAAAWIEGAGLFASAAGGFAFGRLGDRFGRRRAMTLSILVYSGGALLTAAAHGPGVLLLARLLSGFGVGGEWGIGHAVVAETWHGRDRDRVHGILQAGSPLAMALAAVTGLFLAPRIGWRATFLLGALPALLAAAARRAMPGPDRAPAAAERLRPRALLQPGLRRPTLLLLSVLLLHMTGFWCVYAELPQALMRELAVPPATAGRFQLCVNGVHLLADVAFGFLAARFGRRRTFVAFCLYFALAQGALALAFPALRADFGAFTLAAALMGFGAGTWSCFGALFGQHYPAALRATAAATLYSASRGAQLFAKPAMERLFAATGSFAPALWVGALCALGSAGVILLLPAHGGLGRGGAAGAAGAAPGPEPRGAGQGHVLPM